MEKKEFGIKLLASKAFFEDFSKLCKLTVKQIDLFANVFKSDDGFKFGDDEVKKFLVESDVQPETYSSIASLVKYLFDNALSKDVIFDDLFEELVEYAKKNPLIFPRQRLTPYKGCSNSKQIFMQNIPVNNICMVCCQVLNPFQPYKSYGQFFTQVKRTIKK